MKCPFQIKTAHDVCGCFANGMMQIHRDKQELWSFESGECDCYPIVYHFYDLSDETISYLKKYLFNIEAIKLSDLEKIHGKRRLLKDCPFYVEIFLKNCDKNT